MQVSYRLKTELCEEIDALVLITEELLHVDEKER
jgi:hypothetical protein